MTALMGLAARLRLARLYLCTDARERTGDLAEFLAAVFAGGVDLVQIRQPGLAPEVELAALKVARAAAEPYGGIVAVHESAELAGRFGADLLHLGSGAESAGQARRHLHTFALVGRSASTPAEADAARDDRDVDYFCVGPVYATPTEPDAFPVGLDLVSQAAQMAPPHELGAKPWFAVGGINADTLGPVLAAGARRVVVVRALTEADDPRAAAEALSRRVAEAWRADPAMQRYTFAAARG